MPGPARPRPASPSGASPYGARPWLASYPPGVPADLDVPDVPLTRLLDDAAASWPTRTALAFLGTRTTYRELQRSVDGFAGALAGLGVGKGDRVAVVLPNCPQNVIATFAALRLGAVVVQHNPLYTEAELRHQLADCGATVVVCLDRVHETLAPVLPDTGVQHVVVTSLADALPAAARLRLRLPGRRARRARAELVAPLTEGAPVLRFPDLLRGATPARQAPVDPATDLAMLQYTGGTTGAAKGAMLTHRNLVANAYVNRVWDTEARPGEEVCLAALPLFHAFGLTVCMNATLMLGGTLVLLPRFDLDQLFAAVDRWRPTMFPGVPPLYKAIADSPKARAHDLRSLRVCVSGAMKLPVDVQEHFERISGARLVEGYGLTETSPSTHCGPLTGERRPGTIGVPLPSTQARVVDQDDPTREVAPGEPGELAIAGPQVFVGYWGHEDPAGTFTDDGYVLTGDIAVMDDDGWFTVVDRKKELIIAGGFNVYPSEVEQVLLGLEGVADAVVVGVPDRYRGETVKAFVVRAPGSALAEDDVVQHCATALTAYKVPRLVEFREELPRTGIGKVLRRLLQEEERARVEQAQEQRPASVPGGVARRGGGASPGAPEQEAVDRSEVEAPARQAAARSAPPVEEPVEDAAVEPAVEEPAVAEPAVEAPVTEEPADPEPPAETVAEQEHPAQRDAAEAAAAAPASPPRPAPQTVPRPSVARGRTVTASPTAGRPRPRPADRPTDAPDPDAARNSGEAPERSGPT